MGKHRVYNFTREPTSKNATTSPIYTGSPSDIAHQPPEKGRSQRANNVKIGTPRSTFLMSCIVTPTEQVLGSGGPADRSRCTLLTYSSEAPAVFARFRSNVPSGTRPALRATSTTRQSEKPNAQGDTAPFCTTRMADSASKSPAIHQVRQCGHADFLFNSRWLHLIPRVIYQRVAAVLVGIYQIG